MKYKIFMFTAAALLNCVYCFAQDDAYLKKLTEDVIKIRQLKSSKAILNKTVSIWSAADCRKITLMDEIDNNPHEFDGNGANKFQINKVVTYVYGKQNKGMVSKGDYFNSTEKDIFYSAIEKTIMKGEVAKYVVSGHIGSQEFVFISYNPKTPFTVTVNDEQAKPIGEGVQYIRINNVNEDSEIIFSIKNESSTNESFVILNYNPQK